MHKPIDGKKETNIKFKRYENCKLRGTNNKTDIFINGKLCKSFSLKKTKPLFWLYFYTVNNNEGDFHYTVKESLIYYIGNGWMKKE